MVEQRAHLAGQTFSGDAVRDGGGHAIERRRVRVEPNSGAPLHGLHLNRCQTRIGTGKSALPATVVCTVPVDIAGIALGWCLSRRAGFHPIRRPIISLTRLRSHDARICESNTADIRICARARQSVLSRPQRSLLSSNSLLKNPGSDESAVIHCGHESIATPERSAAQIGDERCPIHRHSPDDRERDSRFR